MKTLSMNHILNGYKIFLLVFLGMLTAFGPFTTDMYLSSMPSMADEFGTTSSMVQFSLTSCMIGLAVGQLLFGPMSDKYGRRPVLMFSLWMFIISTVLCLFSDTIQMFVAFRLLQGISAAGGIVISRSIATDMFFGRELAGTLAVVGAINGIAPVLAPVVGGLMTDVTGWKGIFSVLLAIGIVLALACWHYRESLPVEGRVKSNLLHSFLYFQPLFSNRPYMGYMLQLGFAQAALFANIASAPFIMQNHYGFTPLEFSICFGLNALVIVVSAASAAKFKRSDNGTFVGASGLLLFSVCEMIALFSDCSFWVYEIFLVCILFSLGLCFTSSTALAMDSGRKYSGSASALLGAVSFALGGIVSPLVGIGNILHSTGIVFVICAIFSFVCIFFARRG